MVFLFFFASTEKRIHLVETSVGRCQFCSVPACVDIEEHRSRTWWFGFIPTNQHIERMAICRQCGRRIKEVYYTMRESTKDMTIPVVDGKVIL